MKILVAGDFVPQGETARLIEEGNFEAVFGEIPPITAKADYSIVNLEAPVINDKPTPIQKSGPNLYCSSKALDAVKYAGFDCVTLANNHFYDQGENGALTTIRECQSKGFDYVGAGKNIQDASRILYKEIKGQTIAIINCCEHEYSIATDCTAGSNPINPISQYYAITEAKRNADYVVVICHGGVEMLQYPTSRMVEWYRFFVDVGADAVINHHQHCINGYEIYKGHPIVYGLGNFNFYRDGLKDTIWNTGYMVELLFEDVVSFEIYPYRQCNNNSQTNVLEKHDLLNFNKQLTQLNDTITSGNYIDIVQKYFDTNRFNLEWIFTPYKRTFFIKLFRRGIIPSILKFWNWSEISDYVLCQSHNDRLRQFIMNKSNRK